MLYNEAPPCCCARKHFTFPESPAHTVSVVDPLPRGHVGGGEGGEGGEGGGYLSGQYRYVQS